MRQFRVVIISFYPVSQPTSPTQSSAYTLSRCHSNGAREKEDFRGITGLVAPHESTGGDRSFRDEIYARGVISPPLYSNQRMKLSRFFWFCWSHIQPPQVLGSRYGCIGWVRTGRRTNRRVPEIRIINMKVAWCRFYYRRLRAFALDFKM